MRVNSVPPHFGHGGRVSVASSRCTVVPQKLHLYVPIPGFSPVVGIYSSFFLLHLLLASSSASSGVRPRPSDLPLPFVIVVL